MVWRETHINIDEKPTSSVTILLLIFHCCDLWYFDKNLVKKGKIFLVYIAIVDFLQVFLSFQSTFIAIH